MGVAIIIPDADFSSANLGSVTLKEAIPLRALSINGAESVRGSAYAQRYTASYTPASTSQRGVTWSITSGSAYATIDAATGELSVLRGASSSPVTIRCTSTANPSIYAEKAISVTFATDSDLPEGGIQCEVIFSDGNSAFIESGITPLASMSYEVDALWVQPSDLQAVFGYYIGTTRYAPLMRDSQAFEVGYGNYYPGNWPTERGILRCKHKVVIKPTGATIETYTPDGNTLLNSQTFTYSESITFTQTLGLLGRKTAATTIRQGSWYGGLGRMKIYGDDHFGNLVADLNPCYLQGRFGMWNITEGTFLIGTDETKISGFGQNWDTDGFFPNTRNTDNSNDRPGFLTPNRSFHTTRMFTIPTGCTAIRFNAGTTRSDGVDLLFLGNGGSTYVDYNTYTMADREVSVPSGATNVRLSITRSQVDDAYIYDLTNGQYIWKGNNVE